MRKTIFATVLMVTTALQAQILNVNDNNNGSYLPLETKDIKEITFDETARIVTLVTGKGERHSFYTDKIGSISPKTTCTTELEYDLEPTISFDKNDESNFKEVTETVPTDEEDADYGDYVEYFSVGSVVEINFSENEVTVEGLNSDITCQKNGTHITINSKSSKVGYIVSGKCSNGSLKIYSDKKFQIMLSDLDLTNPKGPAINIQTGKTVYFTIDENSNNSLCDGTTYSAPVIGTDEKEEDQKGTLFSEGQLIFDGTGTLNITSHGGHGICSDDYIRIRSGNINILGAAKDGFHTNDKFIVNRTASASPRITVKATADGIDCGKGEVIIDAGKLELTTGGEAIKVVYEGIVPDSITPNATINGGYIKFTTTGDKSSGIKTSGEYTQTDGTIHGTVKGNGSKILNCDSNITFNGGKLTGFAEGTVLNDTTSAGGIKCEGDIKISNGKVAVECSGKGAKGINCHNVTITGGEITIVTMDDDINSAVDKRKSKGIEANNFSMTKGKVQINSHDCAINATKVSLFNGSIHAISDEGTAIDAEVKQTGGWLLTKDAE